MKPILVTILGVVTIAGCDPQPPCKTNADCAAGYACTSESCRLLCFVNTDCPDSDVCLEGTCSARTTAAVPEISAVAGNAQSAPTQVLDGLLLKGRLLDDAVFELRDEAGIAALLPARQKSSRSAEVLLPADVRAGHYTLAATNSFGAAEVSVTLTLPELSGDVLVDRINTEATKPFELALMPAHSHNARDLASGVLDAARLPTDVFAPASALGTGALPVSTLVRGGETTDRARGKPVTVTGGTLVAGGPTNESGSFWSTRESNSVLKLDLLGNYDWVHEITFESYYRGDARFIPEFEGAGAYILEISEDDVTYTALPSVAPTGGDFFVHRINGYVKPRYVRLTIVSPRTAGSEVHICMLRVMQAVTGSNSAIDVQRLYVPHTGATDNGPFCFFAKTCPFGTTDRGESAFLTKASGVCPYSAEQVISGLTWYACSARLCCK